MNHKAVLLLALSGCMAVDPGPMDLEGVIEGVSLSIMPVSATPFPDAPSGHHAVSPGYESWFVADQLRVRSDNWALDLQVTQWGAVADTTVDGTRLARQRDGLTEWYLNTEAGLEYGFDIGAPPPGSGPLAIALDVQGDLMAAVSSSEVIFLTADAIPRLEWSELRAWDARGETLDASFEAEGCRQIGARCQISIVVDDRGAAYPITVDPLMTSLEATGVAVGPGWGGYSVDIDGGWAIIGIPGVLSDDRTDGLAVVLARNVGGVDNWGIDAQLTDAMGGVRFGQAVAIDYPYAVVGIPGSNAVAIFERDAGGWLEINRLEPLSPEEFGAAVDIEGDLVVIGAPLSNAAQPTSGAAYLARVAVGDLTQMTGTATTGSAMGTSIATDGSRILVGAPNPTGEGAVHLFARNEDLGGGGVIEIGKFQPAGSHIGHRFGEDVALSAELIVAGAPGEGGGMIYILDVAGEEIASIPAPLGSGGDFGHDVALEGRTIAGSDLPAGGAAQVHLFELDQDVVGDFGYVQSLSIGASTAAARTPVAIGNGAVIGGAPEDATARVFRRDGERFVLGQLTDFSGYSAGSGEMGRSVATSGAYVFVGAPRYDLSAPDDGTVLVMAPDGSGGWALVQRITPPDESAGNQLFGWSLAVDGRRLMVGCPDHDGAGVDAGAAYLFEWDGGAWLIAHTFAGPAGAGANFGLTVAISGDAIAIGAPKDGDGSVWVYELSRGGRGNWGLAQTLSPAVSGDFGSALDFQMPWLAVGAKTADLFAVNGGAVYIYGITGNLTVDPSPIAPLTILGSGVSTGDRLGSSIALRGDLIAAGAPRANGLGLNRGEVRLYRNVDPTSWTDVATFSAPTQTDEARFGRSVALWSDKLFAAASGTSELEVFERNLGGEDLWGHRETLAPAGVVVGDNFGIATAVTDGRIVVGAPTSSVVGIADGWAFIIDLDAEFAPVGLPDAYQTDEDTVLIVPPIGVLANDDDANGDPITAAVSTQPLLGVLSLAADGSFSYSPNANANGLDTFEYTVDDGNQSSEPVVVTVTITAVNDDPVPTDDFETIDEDTPLLVLAPGVLANDTDIDGDTLSAFVLVEPTDGVLILAADGGFCYTPDPDFNGVDRFTYLADDTESSVPATVTITVNPVPDAPTAIAQDYVAVEDTPLLVPPPGLLTDAADAEGDPLTAMLVDPPTSGDVVVRANGSFDYIPGPDELPIDSFTYQVSDDGALLSAVRTVTITIGNVNDAPTANADLYAVDEDGQLNITAAFGVRSNDIDSDDALADLEVLLVSSTTQGVLALLPNGALSYTPDPNFNGADQFTYRLLDPDGESSNEAAVTLDVRAVNDPPVVDDDVYLAPESGPLEVDVAEGVLSNDTDVDNDALTAIIVEPPTGGNLFLSPSGAFTYTATAGFSGTDGFRYTAWDGTIGVEGFVEIGVPDSDPDTGLPTTTDPDCVTRTFFVDQDGDGWGDPKSTFEGCESARGVTRGKDCDDANGSIYPGAREIAGDGIDQDCDGIDGVTVPVGACQHGSPGAHWLAIVLMGLMVRRRDTP